MNKPEATHRISDQALDINGEPSIFRGCLASLSPLSGGRLSQHVVLAHIDLDEALRRAKALVAGSSAWAPSSPEDLRECYGADEASGLLQYWCMERDLEPLSGE